MSDNGDRNRQGMRDALGRFCQGGSGNPAGRPRGALNRATRIAAQLLEAETERLWRAEIELALAGDRVLLRHCNDRIIGRKRDQPVQFAMPRIADAADLTAATAAVLAAVAGGRITPMEGETLARAAEAGARAIAAGEEVDRRRLAAEQAEVERRYALRVALLLFFGVREIDEEAGDLDPGLRRRAEPILRLGESVRLALAQIPDSPELLAEDAAFMAAHPPRLDREVSPLASAVAQAWEPLEKYLTRKKMNEIERLIEERAQRGEAPLLRFYTGMFERFAGQPWPPSATADPIADPAANPAG